jgi:hypothetical protein
MLSMPADNTVLPTVIQPTSNLPKLTQPSFTWTYGNQQGVEYFLVCVFNAGVPCPAQPTVQRYVVVAIVQGALGFSLPQDVSPFMGQTLYWTVAACNAGLGCFYQQQYRRLQVPIVDGSFDAIYEVTQNAKCKNCHNMHLENETYRRHVQLGRFTKDEIPPSALNGFRINKCQTCHTAATGFTDNWRAPGDLSPGPGDLGFDQPISYDFCSEIKSGGGFRPEFQDHLMFDNLVLWAVDRIPGLGRARWQQKVKAWFNNRAQCPCYYAFPSSPPAPKGCQLHGQFIP